MALATLSVDLVAKLARFEGDMGKAARAVEATKSRIESAAAALKTTLATIGAGIAVDQIVAFTLRTIEGIDALNDMADATGSTVENMSALEDVARRTGANVETVTDAVVKFNGVLSDAEPGSKYADMLNAIGLSADELRRMDPAEALLKTAKALSTFADDGNKARLVQELFGRSVKEISPFLKDLADQGSLNATVTKQQAEEAERFNKQVAALQADLGGLARDLVTGLVPAINKVTQAFVDGRKAGKSFMEIGWENYKREVGAYWEPYMREVGAFWGVTPGKSNGREAVGVVRDAPAAGGGRGFVNPELVKPSIDLPGKSGRPERVTRGRPDASAGDRVSEAERYLKSLQAQLDATRTLTVEERVLADIQSGRLGVVTPAQQASLMDTAQRIDAVRAAAAAEQERNRVMEEGRRIYDETRTPLEALTIAEERLNQLYSAGAIDIETRGRALEQLRQRYEATQKTTEVVSKQMDTFGQRAAENIQGYFGDAFVDMMNGKFESVGDGFVQMINRMVAEAMAAQLARYLFGDMVKGGTGTGVIGSAASWLGSLLSFDGGGSTGSGARTGGLDGKGGFLALLHPQESVLDHTKGQSNGAVSGGTTIIQLTVQAPPGGTRATALQWGRDAMDGMLLARSRNG